MHPQIKIIDNKKVSMTNAEWQLYETICRSYDRNNFKGEELFKNLFETDDNGIIVFLKPPSTRYTSMEVFLFISSLMIHQHIRQMHDTASHMFKQLNDKVNQLEEKLK